MKKNNRTKFLWIEDNNSPMEEFYELSETDFYPPQDDRIYLSDLGVDDIEFGDNLEDYTKWFYETYDEDIVYDNWEIIEEDSKYIDKLIKLYTI